MSDETPNLVIPYLVEGQNSGEVTHNDGLNIVDGICQLSVLDRGLSAPPGSPSNGDRYLVKATGSGAWLGHDGDIASYYDGWVFSTPKEGWIMWVADEDLLLIYDGSAWQTITSVLAAATTGNAGVVLQAAASADLDDDSGGTSGEGTIGAIGIAVTDPGDSPADADALRDDLVTNTIPSIEQELDNIRDAIATLADDINDLKSKMRTAGQLASS